MALISKEEDYKYVAFDGTTVHVHDGSYGRDGKKVKDGETGIPHLGIMPIRAQGGGDDMIAVVGEDAAFAVEAMYERIGQFTGLGTLVFNVDTYQGEGDQRKIVTRDVVFRFGTFDKLAPDLYGSEFLKPPVKVSRVLSRGRSGNVPRYVRMVFSRWFDGTLASGRAFPASAESTGVSLVGGSQGVIPVSAINSDDTTRYEGKQHVSYSKQPYDKDGNALAEERLEATYHSLFHGVLGVGGETKDLDDFDHVDVTQIPLTCSNYPPMKEKEAENSSYPLSLNFWLGEDTLTDEAIVEPVGLFNDLKVTERFLVTSHQQFRDTAKTETDDGDREYVNWHTTGKEVLIDPDTGERNETTVDHHGASGFSASAETSSTGDSTGYRRTRCTRGTIGPLFGTTSGTGCEIVRVWAVVALSYRRTENASDGSYVQFSETVDYAEPVGLTTSGAELDGIIDGAVAELVKSAEEEPMNGTRWSWTADVTFVAETRVSDRVRWNT